MMKQWLKYYSDNKHNSKMLCLFAGIVILAHAIVPHTSHSSYFTFVVNLFGKSLQGTFCHHKTNSLINNELNSENTSFEKVRKENLSKKNFSNKFILDDQPYKMADHPLDTSKINFYRKYFSEITIFCYTDYITRSSGLRAPPLC